MLKPDNEDRSNETKGRGDKREETKEREDKREKRQRKEETKKRGESITRAGNEEQKTRREERV